MLFAVRGLTDSLKRAKSLFLMGVILSIIYINATELHLSI